MLGWICHCGMGTIHHIRRKLNHQQYQWLLECYLVLYARLLYPDEFLQLDNHLTHTSKLIRDWFARRQDIELIDWPHHSPDFNPIGQGSSTFWSSRANLHLSYNPAGRSHCRLQNHHEHIKHHYRGMGGSLGDVGEVSVT